MTAIGTTSGARTHRLPLLPQLRTHASGVRNGRICEGLSDACRIHAVAAHSAGRRSDKPQGRKPRGDQARRCGRFGLWEFDGGRVALRRLFGGTGGICWLISGLGEALSRAALPACAKPGLRSRLPELYGGPAGEGWWPGSGAGMLDASGPR